MEDIFEDYMGVQYREGKQAYKDGLLINPYGDSSQMAKAWQEGFNEEAARENATAPSKAY